MLRFLILFFSFFIASLSVQAAVTTGPIANAVTLAYKPQAVVDTMGLSRLSVPVLAGDTAGMATIGARSTALKLLGAAGRGALGPWGMMAITAAGLCYDKTDWKICHSTNDPIVPITIDLDRIIPASNTDIVDATPEYKYTYSASFGSFGPDIAENVCSAALSARSSVDTNYHYDFTGLSGTSSSICNYNRVSDSSGLQVGTGTITLVRSSDILYTCDLGYFLSDSSGVSDSSGHYCTPNTPKCPSDYILTSSSGGPLSVTGKFCTPVDAYSCSNDYVRTDAYGNSDTQGMFCSYSPAYLTDVQKGDLLAPYLLNYYANQLFSDNNGKPLPDIYTDSDTTFDPTVTPADMPMTWTDLQKYTDWITSGKGQTTNPLAPYYISPSNYNYTKNYINTTNATNTETNTDTTTNVTPSDSSALTQEQYETSTKKLDDAAATAINATDTSSLENLTKTSGFDGANDQLTNISNGNISDLPSLPTPNLPGYSNCQTIDLSWKGNPAVFPSPSQCLKMEEAKKAFGYILYLMTFIGLIFELLRRVE